MKISVRYTAAIHTLLCIHYFETTARVTSDFISASTGVHAVIIRKILLQLQKAQLVVTASGVGGSHLAKKPEDITLRMVYEAINTDKNERTVFNFHPSPNKKCPVGKNMHRVLDPVLEKAQTAMESSLEQTTLADLARQLV